MSDLTARRQKHCISIIYHFLSMLSDSDFLVVLVLKKWKCVMVPLSLRLIFLLAL